MTSSSRPPAGSPPRRDLQPVGVGPRTPAGDGAESAAKDARLEAVHQRLFDAVQDLTTGEGWQHMLRTAAALPTYSPHNVLLITQQCPHARAVAGFHTWKSLGRSVRKAEKGIAILAPMLRRGSTPADVRTDDAAPPVPQPDQDGPGGVPRRVAGFRVVHVFDISQTDGPDLLEANPVLLDGQAPAGLLDGLTRQVNDQGFQLARHDFDRPHPGQGSPNGVTDYFARTVLVRPDLTPAQTVKTLAHELGHVLLHRPGQRPAALTRQQAEVEAESVAYVVTAAHGLDSSGYTIPYVAGWAGGDTQLVARTAERVLSTAKDILTRTPPPPTLELDAATRERLRTREPAAPAAGRTLNARPRGADALRTPPAPAARTASGAVVGRQSADQGRLW